MTLLRSIAVYISTLVWALLFWIAALPAALFSAFLSRRARRTLFRTLLGWFGLLIIRCAWGPFFKVQYEPLEEEEEMNETEEKATAYDIITGAVE